MHLTVSIVDDNPLLRKTLSQLINSTDALECIGLYSSIEEAQHGVAANTPDVLLMDIEMPVVNGIDGTRLIKKQHPDIDIIMLTVFADAEKIVQSICAGASGYLLKKTPPEKIIETISEIRSGGSPMSASVARTVMESIRDWKQQARASDQQELTEREFLVLQRIADGETYAQIGEHLFIAVDTVRTYIRRIYEKLQVHSKTAAVAEAKKRGML
ncbi:MAG: response regulator transcription factor [Ignavibacteria bacterium]|nr:response regulator transcription factor [Ignavibacteria bacterium]